jgi:hypothetical protein
MMALARKSDDGLMN